MKKCLLLYLMAILIFFSACSKIADNNSSKHTNTSSHDFSQELFVINTSSLEETNNPLTENQIKEIFGPLLKKAVGVHETINNDLAEFDIEEEISFQTEQGNYSLITDKKIKTIKDIWDYTYSAYTKDAATRLFSESLNQNGICPRFIEKDGKLYYNRSGRGYAVTFPIESLQIIKQYKTTIIVSIDYCSYDYEPQKSVFIMSKTDEGWRMENSENEAVNYLAKQYIN